LFTVASVLRSEFAKVRTLVAGLAGATVVSQLAPSLQLSVVPAPDYVSATAEAGASINSTAMHKQNDRVVAIIRFPF